NYYRCSGTLRLVVGFFIFCSSSSAFSQSTFTGTVKDKDGLVLPGATVVVLGTNNFTITDADGSFSLNADPGTTIEVSFIGYVSYQFVVSNQTDVTINLIQSPTMLD